MELNDRVNKLEQSTARIEERVEAVKDDIAEIKNNHLFHIQEKLEKLAISQADSKSQIDKMGVKLAFILAGISIVVQLAFQFFFK